MEKFHRYQVNRTRGSGLDPSFGKEGFCLVRPPAHDQVPENLSLNLYSAAVAHDGSILVSGYAMLFEGFSFVYARILPSGILDPAFGRDGYAVFGRGSSYDRLARLLAVETHVAPDGRIYLGEPHVDSGLIPEVRRICALSKAGAFDEDFAGNGVLLVDDIAGVSSSDPVQFMGLDNDGLYLCSCLFIDGEGLIRVWRMTHRGLPDTTFFGEGFVDMRIGNSSIGLPPLRNRARVDRAFIQPDGKWVFAIGYLDHEAGTYISRFIPIRNEVVVFDPEFGVGGAVRIPSETTTYAYVSAMVGTPDKGVFLLGERADYSSFLLGLDGYGRPRKNYGDGDMDGLIDPLPFPEAELNPYQAQLAVDQEGRCLLLRRRHALDPVRHPDPNRVYRFGFDGKPDGTYGAGGFLAIPRDSTFYWLLFQPGSERAVVAGVERSVIPELPIRKSILVVRVER